MAVIEGGVSAALAGVGAQAYSGLHVAVKPIDYGALGHYRVTWRCAILATQAANSRLFEVRNTHATNLVIPTRLVVKWLQIAAHTAAIEDSLDVYQLTSFSVVDSANQVALTPVRKRSTMAASPVAVVQGVTATGAAAGMTGGMFVRGGPVAQLPAWLLAAQPTAGVVPFSLLDAFDDINGTHPFVFVQNEGFCIENRVLLGAAAGSSVYIDFSWAETTAF